MLKVELNKINNILKYIALTGILWLVFYTPYLRGLYFETEQRTAIILSFVIFFIFILYKILKKEHRILKTPLDIGVLALAIIYFIATFVAVSYRDALIEALKYCMLFIVFIMLSDLLKNKKTRTALLWVIAVSSAGVARIGLDGAMDNLIVNFLNNIANKLGYEHDLFFGLFVHARINSTMQYPNALAIYLLTGAIISTGLISLSKSVYSKIIASCLAFNILVSFFYTFSRGTYLLVPVVFILFLILIPKQYKIKTLFYGAAPFIALFLLIVNNLDTINVSNKDLNAITLWLILGLLATVILTVLVYIFEKKLNNIKYKVFMYSISGITIISAITAIILLSLSSPVNLKGTVSRDIKLKQGNEYTLSYSIDAKNTKEKDSVYNINIRSINSADIVNQSSSPVISEDLSETTGRENRELSFTVPEDSRYIRISFANKDNVNNITIYKIRAINDKTGKKKNIPLSNAISDKLGKIRLINVAESINVLSRTVYYKDGRELLKERPLLGAGGGSWGKVYFSKQSFLYWTTQPHSYPLQLAVETGIAGLLIALFIFIIIILKIIRQQIKKDLKDEDALLHAIVSIAIITLLIHVFYDFDFSLTAIFIVFIALLAVLNSYTKDAGILNKFQNNYFLYGMIIIGLLIITIPVRQGLAARQANKTLEYLQEEDLEQAIMSMKKASILDKSKPEYKLDAGNLIIRKPTVKKEDLNVAEKYVDEAYESGKYNIYYPGHGKVPFLSNVLRFYLKIGDLDKAVEISNRIIELQPLVSTNWQQKLELIEAILEHLNENGREKEKDKYINEGLKIFEDIEKANENRIIHVELNEKSLELIKIIKEEKSSE
jgi:O-antigen ligase